MKQTFSLIALIAAFPAFAEDTRELDAHEHGVGTLNIATDGTTVGMAFEAPGADIVGFEYAAESDTDLAAIDSAVATLGAPLDLFVMPDAAGCTLVEAQAGLEGENEDEEHHDDHANEGHDDHTDEDQVEHADEAGHTEFHAEYTLNCDDPDALTEITFAYFEAFPNAQEVEVQMITGSSAHAFEVTRDAPVLDLGR
ncbi:MAG: hypothetical protein ACI9HB_003320 [Gammaproteobacteria bacterium]|jgi:hypothetical protein